MSSETRRVERIRALFERCIAVEDGERVRLLEEAGEEDEELMREVRELLAIDARYDGELDPPDPEALGEGLAARKVGRVIGPWRLEAVLGRGGMSTVYRARRIDEEFEQLAAVKVVRRGMDTDDILRRFRGERRVLADLEHPGIAHLLDGGSTEDELPYLAMEYVHGVPVDRFCDERSLDVTARLRLFLSVCEAVQHAHERGVIHRDLKPSNILVTADGHPKLLDFGIAKLLDTTASPGTVNVTATELRLMTPEYASPEQVRGHAIGPTSDVYSLGVVLYELLSGHRPYRLTTRLRHELEQAICELDPPRPSAAVGRAPESRRLRARLAGDLDTIVLMALRKEPERRYATVAELAGDIERWLEGRPVLARPDTWRYRTTKFVRRNKVVVAATLVVGLVLVAGLVTSTTSWLDEASARAETTEALRQSRARGLSSASFEALETDPMLALLLARMAEKLDRTPETLARVHQAVGLVREEAALRFWGSAAVCSVDLSPSGDALLAASFDRIVLRNLDGTLVHFPSLAGWYPSGRFSPSGEFVLTAVKSTAGLYDRGGRELASYSHGADVELATAAFSPDERHLLTATRDGTVKIWRRDHPLEPVATLDEHDGVIVVAEFSLDGRHLLVVSMDSKDGLACVYEFDPEGGSIGRSVRLVGHEGKITTASFSPTGDRIVTASSRWDRTTTIRGEPDYTARIWNLDGKEVLKLPEDSYEIKYAVFSPDGRRILTSANRGGGRLYDLEGQRLREYPVPHSGVILSQCAFSGDGKVVGFCCFDGSILLYKVSGNPIGVLQGHDGQILTLRFTGRDARHGPFVATSSYDGTARLWSIRDEEVPTFREHRGAVLRAVYSPDGTKIATCGDGNDARIWDASGREIAPLVGHDGAVHAIAFDAGGDRLVTCGTDFKARIWNLDGEELQVLPHPPNVINTQSVAFSPDGTLIATGCGDGSVWLWNTDGTVRERHPVTESPSQHLKNVEFSSDGERILIAASGFPVRILSLQDGSVRSLPSSGLTTYATYTPAGQILMSFEDGSGGGRVALVTDDGELIREFLAHESTVHWAEMSPKEDRIVTASHDRSAKIWRADGTLEATLRGHEGFVWFAGFSPDGTRVVTASGDGTARTWIVDPEELLALAEERTTRDLTEAECIRYEKYLALPARDAKKLVDRLFKELGEWDRVLESLRQDPELDDALREMAIRFAEARAAIW